MKNVMKVQIELLFCFKYTWAALIAATPIFSLGFLRQYLNKTYPPAKIAKPPATNYQAICTFLLLFPLITTPIIVITPKIIDHLYVQLTARVWFPAMQVR